MKRNWNNYTKWGITAFLVVACCILFFFTLLRLGSIFAFISKILSILTPVLLGILIGYLINPIVVTFNRWFQTLFYKWHMKEKNCIKLARILSIAFGMILFISLLAVFVFLVVPELATTVKQLVSNLLTMYSQYTVTLTEFVNKVFAGSPEIQAIIIDAISSLNSRLTTWLGGFLVQASSLLSIASSITSSIIGIFSTLLNIVVGLIVAVYVLLSKDKFIGQAKKILYMLLAPDKANALLSVARQSNKIFGGYVSGMLLDSICIGILCFVCLSLFGMPYPLLISVLIGVTNIIPFFGPFIGAIPSAFLILIVDPVKCFWFVVFIIIVQQIEGNIIAPKILGDSTGLSSFWVIVAILIGKGLFGFVGMLLGVPVFALIYYITKCLVELRLRSKSLPEETMSYCNLDRIDPDSGNFLYLPSENIMVQPKSRHKAALTFGFGDALDEIYNRRNGTSIFTSESKEEVSEKTSIFDGAAANDNLDTIATSVDKDEAVKRPLIKQKKRRQTAPPQEVIKVTKDELIDRR